MEKRTAKKPFYKKWWVWALAIILIAFVAIPTEETEQTAVPDDQVGENQTEETENEKVVDPDGETVENSENQGGQEETPPPPADEEKEELEIEKIEAGTYKVGTDLPAGEYLVLANRTAYIEATKDSSGQLDSILFNDNLPSGSHTYVTLKDGEYFKLQSAEMYPVDSSPSVIPNDGLYKDGMYKVGQDIPAGEYKIHLDSTMGYIEVSTNSRHQLDSIVSNENVQADTYLTVSEGQYLTLRDVTIQE